MTSLGQPRAAVIRLGALGDLVLATSVTQALSSAGYLVTLVCEQRYAALARAAAGVASVVTFDRVRHRGLRGLAAVAREVGAVEVAIDLQNKPRTYLLSQLLRARRRRALELRSGLGRLRALVGRDRIIHDRHQIALAFEVVRDLVEVEAGVAPASVAGGSTYAPRPRLRTDGARAQQVALVPGAAHAAKRWPAERFGQLARRLRAAGRQVVTVVGPGEERLQQAVDAEAGEALPTTQGQGVDVVLRTCASAALVIGGDSGPLHVAAAMDTPTIALFGPTSEVRWRPIGPGEVLTHAEPCRPCTNHSLARCPLQHHRCLREISVEQVHVAACSWLAGGSR